MDGAPRPPRARPVIRVSQLSTLERRGGAARAAYRLHRALLGEGVASTLVVHRRESDDPTVVGLDRRFGALSFYVPLGLDDLVTRALTRDRTRPRSAAVFARSLARALREAPCDVAHLHWINGGFLRPESLPAAARPLVWTLHDEWPFCGAEHYTGSAAFATGYAGGGLGARLDLDRWVHGRKRRAYARVERLAIVAPSAWMARRARESVLFRDRPVHVIPNTVDTAVLKPLDRRFSRDALGLPQDRDLALVVALNPTSDPRKGWPRLERALHHLASWGVELELVVVGACAGPRLPVRAHYLGELHDEPTLALACSAADVSVCPSLQENLPNTVLEALACGTPAVAHDVGGLPDLVTHGVNGWLAPPDDPTALAAGIRWALADPTRRASLRAEARAVVVRRFAPQVVASRHRELYEELLGRR